MGGQRVAVAVGGLCLLLLGVGASFWSGRPKVTAQQSEQSLRQHLPLGSSFQEVERYLQATGWEYSWSEDSQTFYAIQRNVRRGLLVQTNITMEFHMDEARTLQTIQLREVHTDP